jgi:hypothetical protein
MNKLIYRAIVDTGSPYLVLPSSEELRITSNQPTHWIGSSLTDTLDTFFGSIMFNGNRERLTLANSEYQPTEEIYGSVKGQIEWKLASYQFRDPRLQISRQNSNSKSKINILNASKNARGVVGVLDYALTIEATGGADTEPYALLGLVQNINPNADTMRFPQPRPTFFEQERILGNDLDEYKIKSFSLNGPRRELTISSENLVQSREDAMPLLDLRPYGDFVDHYAVLVDSVTFNNLEIVNSESLQKASRSSVKRPIVAVFDSGLTGCLLTRPFWEVMQTLMTKAKEKDVLFSNNINMLKFYSVAVSAAAKTTLQSSTEDDPRLFYVNPIELDWFDDEETCPYVIVLGQTFLSKGVLTIDMEQRLTTFSL